MTMSSCERLNSVTGKWISGPDLTTPRHQHAVAVLHGELWVAGSFVIDTRSCSQETERLDAVTDGSEDHA